MLQLTGGGTYEFPVNQYGVEQLIKELDLVKLLDLISIIKL